MQGKVSYNVQAWADIGNFPGAMWNVELGDNTCLIPNLVHFWTNGQNFEFDTVSGGPYFVLKLRVEWNQVAWFLHCFNFYRLGPEFRQNLEHFHKNDQKLDFRPIGGVETREHVLACVVCSFTLTLGILCGKCSCGYYFLKMQFSDNMKMATRDGATWHQ